MNRKGIALGAATVVLILGGSAVAYRLMFDQGQVDGKSYAEWAEQDNAKPATPRVEASAGASTNDTAGDEVEARRVIEELIKRCKRGETAVADLFASERVGDFPVDSYVSQNRYALSVSEIRALGQTDGVYEFEVGSPGNLSTPGSNYFKCVVGQRDDKWKITGFHLMRRS